MTTTTMEAEVQHLAAALYEAGAPPQAIASTFLEVAVGLLMQADGAAATAELLEAAAARVRTMAHEVEASRSAYGSGAPN